VVVALGGGSITTVSPAMPAVETCQQSASNQALHRLTLRRVASIASAC